MSETISTIEVQDYVEGKVIIPRRRNADSDLAISVRNKMLKMGAERGDREPGRYPLPMTHTRGGQLAVDYELVLRDVLPPPRQSATPSPRGGIWGVPDIDEVFWRDRDILTWLGDTPLHMLYSLATDRHGLMDAIETHALAWGSHKGAEVAETGLGPLNNPNVNGALIAAGTVTISRLLRG